MKSWRTIHVAHQAGIVHRDLKPGNIILAPASPGQSQSQAMDADALAVQEAFGVPKILDFGLAKRLDMDMHTRSGDLLGTPSYMSPEQASGKTQEIGPAADIYALGAILYELLTGRPPFRAATPMDTLWQVLNDTPVSPASLASRSWRGTWNAFA